MLGTKKLLRRLLRRSGRGLVLFGHGVSTKPSEEFVSSRSLHVPMEEFTRSIEFCRELGFEFISMEDLTERAEEGFPPGRPWLHLTFDDGYESNYTLLDPFLREEKIPWSVFVSTHHAATGARFYHYVLRCAIFHARVPITLPGAAESLPAGATERQREQYFKSLRYKSLGRQRLLELVDRIRFHLTDDQWQTLDRTYADEAPITKEQLRKLAKDPLVHIGSHCHHHVILNDQVTREEAAAELIESKKWLREEVGVEATAFCYPNGQPGEFSPMTRELCAEAGYRVAFTTVADTVGRETDPYEIPRRALAPTARKTRRKLSRTVLRSLRSRSR